MRVRPAVGTDIPAIRDVLVRTWHDTYDAIYGAERVTEITDRWHSIANLTRQLVRPLSTFLVAESAGRILGTAKGVADESGGVTLERLYVDPAAQRAGVGCQLLNAMLAAYPLAPDVRVEVEPRNEKAVAFYRGHGFEPAGKTADCGGDSGYAADRMRKILREGRPDRAPALMLRPVRDADAQDLIGLIALCFAEYSGCYFDPHADMPDIVQPAQSRIATEGCFLVAEDATGRVCACAGLDFPEPGAAELHRLYVRPDMRGRGLARGLTRRMEDFARECGAARMILWSDTRFTKAHALYENLGYVRGAASRSLGDISGSREFFFQKPL